MMLERNIRAHCGILWIKRDSGNDASDFTSQGSQQTRITAAFVMTSLLMQVKERAFSPFD
jgi:hypothetical protein